MREERGDEQRRRRDHPGGEGEEHRRETEIRVVEEQGAVFAKGLCRYTSESLRTYRGRRTADLPDGLPHEVVHRDDLVVLP